MAKLVVKNVAYGHTIGTGQARRFYPRRSSSDYDPTYLKGPEGVRAREKEKKAVAKKKAKKITKKTVTKKAAKKNPKVPIGKYLPARLNKNGTVTFQVPLRKAMKKAKR